MKITKGTIIRTIMLIVVLINLVLKSAGKSIINIDEGSVQSLVELLIEAAIIIVAWWKNNSFSKSAIQADEYLHQLQKSELDDTEK